MSHLWFIAVFISLVTGNHTFVCEHAEPGGMPYFTVILDRTLPDCITVRDTNTEQTVKRVLDWINKQEDFFGTRVGVRYLDTCSSASRAARLVASYIRADDGWSAAYPGMTCSNQSGSESGHLGFISAASTEAVVQMAGVMAGTNHTLINMGSPSDKLREYTNVYSVGHSQRDYSWAVTSLARHVGLTCVSALYSDNMFGREGFATFAEMSREHGISVVFNESVTSATTLATLNATGMPDVPVIYIGTNAFEIVRPLMRSTDRTLPKPRYWVVTDPEMTWMPESLEEESVAVISPLTIGEYSTGASDALYTLMTAYKQVRASIPAGESLDGDLEGEVKKWLDLSPTVSYAGTMPSAGFDYSWTFENGSIRRSEELPLSIHKLSDVPLQIGSVSSQHVNISLDNELFKCDSTCSRGTVPDFQYVFVPGDFVILATIPVHNERKEWLCKSLDKNGVIYSEAIQYAAERMSDILNITMGYVIIDSCYNTLSVARILPAIMSGRVVISRIIDGKTEILDVTKVVASVSDLSSDVTIGVHNLLRHLKIVQVSYGSTTPLLDNPTLFPYFLRTVPSDRQQALNMVTLMERFNFTAFQLLHTTTTYALTGAQLVKEFAIQKRICLVNEITLGAGATLEDMQAVGDSIQAGSQAGATVVVYFGEEVDIANFVHKHLALPNNQQWWRRKGMIFIGSEIWGAQQTVLEHGSGTILRGSLTFDLERGFAIAAGREADKDFQTYLRKKNTAISANNVWLNNVISSESTCTISDLFNPAEQCIACVNNGIPLDSSKSFVDVKDAFAVHIVKAVFAIGYGIRNLAFDSGCSGEIVNCHIFRKEFVEQLYQEVKTVKIPPNSFATDTHLSINDFITVFGPDGNGFTGYEVLSIQRNTSSGTPLEYFYKRVFSITLESVITEIGSGPVFWKETEDLLHDDDHIPSSQCGSRCPNKCKAYLLPASLPGAYANGSSDVNRLINAFHGLIVLFVLVTVGLVGEKVYPYIRRRNPKEPAEIPILNEKPPMTQGDHNDEGRYDDIGNPGDAEEVPEEHMTNGPAHTGPPASGLSSHAGRVNGAFTEEMV